MLSALHGFWGTLRNKALVCLALVAGLFAAACDPSRENVLIERGIGTELYEDTLPEATRLQDLYITYLCQQAGMASVNDNGSTETVECNFERYGAASWMVLVRAGFNDIDRRCDSYLAWLNSRRRNQNAFTQQLADGQAFTQALMNITGSGPNAITAAGLAFALASNTFTNFYSRLLLEIEKSTVEIVVQERRFEFRKEMSQPDAHILLKPDAIHVLREYLLICTPHRIENSINQRTREAIAGITPLDKDNPEQVRQSISTDPIRAAMPGFRPQRARERPDDARTGKYTGPLIEAAVQRALCVGGDGKLGPRTEQAIKIYQRANRQEDTGSLSDRETGKIINSLNDCPKGLLNFQEREYFRNNPKDVDKLNELRTLLATVIMKRRIDVTINPDDTLDELRDKIDQVRAALGGDVVYTGDQEYLNRQITPEFLRELIRQQ